MEEAVTDQIVKSTQMQVGDTQPAFGDLGGVQIANLMNAPNMWQLDGQYLVDGSFLPGGQLKVDEAGEEEEAGVETGRQGHFDENNIVDIQTNNLAAHAPDEDRINGMLEMTHGDKSVVRSQIIEGPTQVASNAARVGATSGGIAGQHAYNRDSEELKISNARSPGGSRISNVKNSAATGETMVKHGSKDISREANNTIPMTRGTDAGVIGAASMTSVEIPNHYHDLGRGSEQDAQVRTGTASLAKHPVKSAGGNAAPGGASLGTDDLSADVRTKVESPLKEGLPISADVPYELVGWKLAERNFKTRIGQYLQRLDQVQRDTFAPLD